MKVRLFGFAAVLVAVAGFAFGPSFSKAFADEVKKDEGKKAEKSDCGGCCEGDKKDEKSCDKDAAKAKGCDGCGESVAKMPKAISCPDCDKSAEGPCAKCKEAVDTGKVSVLPVKGMSCGNCEGAVAKKLEGMANVAKYYVNHRFGVAVVIPAAGKTVKLSEMTAAFTGSEFSINESAPVKGVMTLHVTGVADKKATCEALAKLVGDAKKCSNCSSDDAAKTGTYTIGLGFASKVSIKDLRDALGAAKIADIEFRTCEGKCEKAADGKS